MREGSRDDAEVGSVPNSLGPHRTEARTHTCIVSLAAPVLERSFMSSTITFILRSKLVGHKRPTSC